MLISASYDKEFVFHDGSRAKNLLELVSKIDFLSDHEFHQFVNHHKNDFANWTEHVLGDKHFANKLRTIPSKHETALAIRDKISNATFGNSIIKIPKVEKVEEVQVYVPEHVIEPIIHHDVHHEIEHNKTPHHEPHHAEPIYKVHPVEHEVEQHKDHEHKIDEHKENKKEDNTKTSVKRHWLFSRREPKKILPELHHEVESPIVEHHKASEKIHEKYEEKAEEERPKESKIKHNLFHLFSKKILSKKDIEKIVVEKEEEIYPETTLEDEAGQNGRENALWVILYFALVLLIITLLIYRLFL